VILASADRIDTVTLRVADAADTPLPNVALTWTSDDPDAVVTPLDAATNAQGIVRAEWRLSGAPGTWKLRAEAPNGRAAEAEFTVTSWSVKQAVYIAGRTCVQSHQDQLWCRASDLAPLELQLGGATIRALDGSFGGSPDLLCAIVSPGDIQCAEVPEQPALPLDFRTVPGQATNFRSLHLSAGSSTYCALDDAGQAWCWGRYFLGDGPYRTDARESVGRVTQEEGVVFTTMSVDYDNGCALDTTGTPWCWGESSHGVTGTAGGPDAEVPRRIDVSTPLMTLVTPTRGRSACGLAFDRRVICWGLGITFGELGDQLTPRVLAGVGDAVDLVPMPDGYIARRIKGELMGWGGYWIGHGPEIGAPDMLRARHGIRARSVFRGLGVPGKTCIDDAFGRGTTCIWTAWLIDGPASRGQAHWIGLVPPE
jgi:hypothetical protein